MNLTLMAFDYKLNPSTPLHAFSSSYDSGMVETMGVSTNSFDRAAPSLLPRSTFTIDINGTGSPIKIARKKNAGRISPVMSVMAPTIKGPNTLLPLSVTAYKA